MTVAPGKQNKVALKKNDVSDYGITDDGSGWGNRQDGGEVTSFAFFVSDVRLCVTSHSHLHSRGAQGLTRLLATGRTTGTLRLASGHPQDSFPLC